MKTWVRRTGIVVGALFAVVVLALGAVYAVSSSRLDEGHEATAHAFDPASGDIAEGRHLAGAYGCQDCHGEDLAGMMLIDGMPFARIAAPNLTAGRAGGALTDEQWELGVRHGIGRDGRALVIMPSPEYVYLSDSDLADLVAYARTLPAVTDTLPARAFGPVGRTMVALGKMPTAVDLMPAGARHLPAPEKAPTREFGAYLTRLCTGCHGPDLAGGQPPDPAAPPAPNLTPAGNLANWSYEQFEATLRKGTTPEGKVLNPQFMPWTAIGKLKDTELGAIWVYLTSLEPVQPTT